MSNYTAAYREAARNAADGRQKIVGTPVAVCPVAFDADPIENIQYSVLRIGFGYGAIAVPTLLFRGIRYLALVRQFRFPLDEDTWEFPRGGTISLEESDAATELVEETGLEGDLAPLGILYPDTGIADTRVSVWQAHIAVDDFDPNDRQYVHPNKETDKVKWVTDGELLAMITSGQISCSMTLAAYMMLVAKGPATALG